MKFCCSFMFLSSIICNLAIAQNIRVEHGIVKSMYVADSLRWGYVYEGTTLFIPDSNSEKSFLIRSDTFWDSVDFETELSFPSNNPSYYLFFSMQEHHTRYCAETEYGFYFRQSRDTLYAIYEFCGTVRVQSTPSSEYVAWPVSGDGYKLVKCDSLKNIGNYALTQYGFYPSSIRKIELWYEE